MLETKEVVSQLGTLVRRYRNIRGKSIREVSREAKMSMATISLFETNTTGSSISTFVRLCEYLDIPAQAIVKAMTEKDNSLLLGIKQVKCCANCTNSTKGTSFICTVTGKYTSPDLCCRKYKGE